MIIRAKYLLPNSNELIENGAVCVAGTEIADVGNYASVAHDNSGETYDFGEAVILPGFVNAHAHLELTGLHGKVKRTDSLPDWLMQLMQHRKRTLNRLLLFFFRNMVKKWVRGATARGIEMSLAGGVTTIADITNSGWQVETLKNSPIRKLIFHEVIGFETSRQEPQLNAKLKDTQTDSLLTFGISPHAPYSVSADLYGKCVKIATSKHLLLCTHLAETQDEGEFLMSGTGEFRDFLERLGISVENWQPPRTTPVKYMHNLGVLESGPLLAHCNYLEESDIPLLKNSSVVFCPRSHNYFYHRNHPFEQLLSARVNVALGTDSLASNDSLSMLDEIKFLHKTHYHIPPVTLLKMATLNGAKALKLKAQIGALQRGWQSDIIVLKIPTGTDKVIERIFAEESENIFTMVAGRICFLSRYESRPT